MPMPKFLHHQMAGAPTNTSAAGSIVGILDDCLVNGFNIKTALSAECTAGVTTLTFAASHNYEDQAMLKIASSAPFLAGERRSTVTSALTLTVPTPGQPDGSIGAAVETRVAPLGWETVFTGTNVRVFRSPNVEGPRGYFRWEDTSTGVFSAGVRGYMSMSDINTGVDPFPTAAQISGTGSKVYKSTGGAQPWAVVGDDRTVYIFSTDATVNLFPLCFGDVDSYKSADGYGAIVSQLNGGAQDNLALSSASAFFIARPHTQAGSATALASRGPISQASGTLPFPSDISGGATLAKPVYLLETNQIRGTLRGLLHVFEAVTLAPSWAILEGVLGASGRVLTISCGTAARIAFELDAPW